VLAGACDGNISEEARLSQVLKAERGELARESMPSFSGEEISANNSAGRCCWGHCNSSGAFYSTDVSAGCRDWVVAVCHYAGSAFNPSGDAWWGSCH